MKIQNEVKLICQKARMASLILTNINETERNKSIVHASENLKDKVNLILSENEKDIENAIKIGINSASLDRLKLDKKRVFSICDSMIEISKLNNPVGKILSKWERPNGLKIEKVSVPLGVIGVIFESRPNVAADAAALCLKSGNAVILRGGSESFFSTSMIIKIINESYKIKNLPEGILQNIPTKNREAVDHLLVMNDYIDVIIPRGGKSLIKKVDKESKIPIFRHLDGICHTYIHESANQNIAKKVLINAKMRRTGICGATETLLIDKNILSSHLPKIISTLKKLKCEIRGDKFIKDIDSSILDATTKDWETEYLDSIISIKTVLNGVDEAINHINKYGSGHTDSIICEDKKAIEKFLNNVDSGIVMHNTSTQFADGGEFGMGAEIGISTSKLHARGPVGVAQLTSFKYKVRGNGQIRP